MKPVAEPIVGGTAGYSVPLIVAVTGHRDLVSGEIAGIRKRVSDFLENLQSEHPECDISVMSSLAEGADSLVADVALKLGIPLTVPLPMSADDYLDDFETPESRAEFRRLCDSAAEILELPALPGRRSPETAEDGNSRALQYAQLGVFLSAHCHILLALWDGRYNDRLGGTGQVVRFHHDDVMPGFTTRAAASRLTLADDESDLVYHVVCSRDRPDGQPADGLEPLRCYWFTAREHQPRTGEMPQRHRRVFEHLSEFNRDARAREAEIRSGAWPLVDEKDPGGIPAGARDIDRVFGIADWLAIHFQKRTMFVLRATHLLALLMGFAYILYSDLVPRRILVIAFVFFFAVAAAIHMIGRHRGWHRKYLDYRTLAEGLRVQFYWAAAGVTSGIASKFAHDNFLQMQDPDLGWIRNVMRVAGTEADVSKNADPKGVAFSVREWIGDRSSGQLGYYRRKAGERFRRRQRTERLATIVLSAGFLAIGLFIFAPDAVGEIVRDPVVVLMGVLLLLVGVRRSYSFSTADAELLKQYEFMHRIFTNARHRIKLCETDEERRRVLKSLGEAALDEHAEWILTHRERSVDKGQIWSMSG